MSVYLALGVGKGRKAQRALERETLLFFAEDTGPGALPGHPQNWGLQALVCRERCDPHSSHSLGKPEFMAKNESSPPAAQ